MASVRFKLMLSETDNQEVNQGSSSGIAGKEIKVIETYSDFHSLNFLHVVIV